jgi:hypothetical protein
MTNEYLVEPNYRIIDTYVEDGWNFFTIHEEFKERNRKGVNDRELCYVIDADFFKEL